MCPCSTLYWYGDAFARGAYAVLAVNVGHRTHSEFYADAYSSDNTPAEDYDCTDGQEGDGPDNHPQQPITAPGMGPSDDGERTWNVLGPRRHKEYIDTSDLHALVAPRLLIVQTGKKDHTYSEFTEGPAAAPCTPASPATSK